MDEHKENIHAEEVNVKMSDSREEKEVRVHAKTNI